MLAHLKGRPNELVIFVVFFSEGFVRVTSGKNNKDSFDTLCVSSRGLWSQRVLCRPASTKPVSRLVFGLKLWPTHHLDVRLVQAPTDRHDGDLCPVKGALEKLGIVAVLAIVKLKKTWAAGKNWLMRPANLTVRTAIPTRS